MNHSSVIRGVVRIAIGTKFDAPDQLGPQSKTPAVSGARTDGIDVRWRSREPDARRDR